MVSFNCEILPQYVHILGEYNSTKVSPYQNRPLHCSKCQEYGHVLKRCGATQFTGGHCSKQHETKDCTMTIKCVGVHGSLCWCARLLVLVCTPSFLEDALRNIGSSSGIAKAFREKKGKLLHLIGDEQFAFVHSSGRGNHDEGFLSNSRWGLENKL